MKFTKSPLLLLVILAMGVLLPSLAHALPSELFHRLGKNIYDDWGISRTRAGGPDGFLALTRTGFDPIIVRESLGENADLAWRLGEEFAQKYPDRNQRAEQIFYFVRDRVEYISDADQFGSAEFAQNADEVAATIVENGAARGDCEDTAFLLAVMYKAAGYRSAVALAPGHMAALVYLPEYRKAARVLHIAGEEGWVWAEATARTNRFGWLPQRYADAQLLAREITIEAIAEQEPAAGTATVVTRSSGNSAARFSPFFGVIGLLWLISSLRGQPAKKKKRSS